MRKHVLSLFVGLGICAAGAVAYAGFSQASYVRIEDSTKYADGTVTGARNSPDNTQYLHCDISGYASGMSDGACTAVDATGKVRRCYAKNDQQRASMAAAGPASYIAFYWQDDGYCSYVTVSNGSRWQ